ncbi:MAG: hypothetical protein FIA99_02755 [Ruminiclostridium sp.]|nr:hypothetical protein [Ruminiclostridium sp.]
MKFCILKEIITPDIAVFMAGFTSRTHKSEGVHDDPYVKVILLQANKPVLLIALDLLGGDRSFTDGIKASIYEKFGLKKDDVFINFSHTHHTVGVTGEDAGKRLAPYSITQESYTDRIVFDNLDYSEDVRYYNFLREKIIKLTGQCFENLEEGKMLLGKGTSRLGVSRRLRTPQGIKWAPDYAAEIDNDLFVIKLLDKNENVKGILFSYGCHPTAMSGDNYLLTAEFPGSACRYLENAFEGSSAVFLQACGGDVKPLKCAEGDRFKSCGFQEMEETGADLAKDVIKVMTGSALKEIVPSFRTCLIDARLYTEVLTAQEFEEVLRGPGGDELKQRINDIMESIRNASIKQYIPFYIAILCLDDKTKIIGLEGEIVSGLGKKIKNLFKSDDILVLGYTNGTGYYVPSREILEEGGYEGNFPLYLGLSGPFIPEIENIIFGRILTSGCAGI